MHLYKDQSSVSTDTILKLMLRIVRFIAWSRLALGPRPKTARNGAARHWTAVPTCVPIGQSALQGCPTTESTRPMEIATKIGITGVNSQSNIDLRASQYPHVTVRV